jgi:4-aminobutyrate aminotransferase/(S)-3-amino-2-methylpropionate transaminase
VGEAFLGQVRERTLGRGVNEVRGRGLMIGVLLEGGAERALEVTRRLLGRGWIVLTGGADGDVLTLTPPLNIEESLLADFAGALAQALATT